MIVTLSFPASSLLFGSLCGMFILFFKFMTSNNFSEGYLPLRSNRMEELLSEHVTSLDRTVLLITRAEL